MNEVRVRMAPSPTGNLHIGTAYATLWPYLFARHNKGTFILRIEDTDEGRSTKEFEENIIQGLKWLGLEWDELFHQMDRLDTYQKYADQLLSESKAYYCFCSKEVLEEDKRKQQADKKPIIYVGRCRDLDPNEAKKRVEGGEDYVVRLKVPENRGAVEFDDVIHGKVSINSNLIGDTVIMRQSGVPLYNFAVVVDDIEMKITHIIRGDDHTSNTPKQILIYEALGKDIPEFAHFPVILNQDRHGKLSKRAGSTSVDDFRKDGYLAEALLNYISLLGFALPNGKEIFSKDELIAEFDLKKMTHTPAAWNEQKLDWLNGEYIRAMSDEELAKRLVEFLPDHPAKNEIAKVAPLIKERIKKLSDFVPLTDFLWEEPDYDMSEFRKLTIDSGQLKIALKKVAEKLEKMPKPWNSKEFEETFRDLAKELGIKDAEMFQLIRLAVSGQLVSPPLFESIQILGEEETIKRAKKIAEKFPEIEDIQKELALSD